MNIDGTLPWPDSKVTPVDRVSHAHIDVLRARIHVRDAQHHWDVAMNELTEAIGRLVEAAKGGHT